METKKSQLERVGELVRKLSYLNVELADLQSILEHDELDEAQAREYRHKVSAQVKIISAHKKELVSAFSTMLAQTEIIGDIKQEQSDLIPNYNTLSTLIDRIAIENVKSYHFARDMDRESLPTVQRENLQRKITLQERILDALVKELVLFFKNTVSRRRYEFLKEERTFV